MFPTLQDLAPWLPPIETHGFFVALGLAAAGVVFLIEKRRRGVTDPRIPYLVLGALVGAALLSRLGTWAQHLDPSRNLSLVDQLLHGNASMLSALVGAWLGVHVAKRIVRYPERTGDLFAPAVALAMAIGRIGCLLTERPGTPTGAGWGIVLSPEAAAPADRGGRDPDPLHRGLRPLPLRRRVRARQRRRVVDLHAAAALPAGDDPDPARPHRRLGAARRSRLGRPAPFPAHDEDGAP